MIAVGQIRAHQDPDKLGVRVRVESGPETKTNRMGEVVVAWRVRVVHPYEGNQTTSIKAERLERFPLVGAP